MRRRARWSPGNRAALLLCLGAAALAGAAGWRALAWEMEPEPRGYARVAVGGEAVPAARVVARSPASRGLEDGILAADPFSPTRRPRPAGIPPAAGQPLPAPAPGAPPPPAPVLPFRVTGVVTLGAGRGMASIEAEGLSPRLLAVGDSIAGFRVALVSATLVRLERTDTTLLLRVPSAPNGS